MEEFEERRRVMPTTGGMMQPSQQHDALCVKEVEKGLGKKGSSHGKQITYIALTY